MATMMSPVEKLVEALENAKIGAPISVKAKLQARIADLELNEIALGNLEFEFSWEDLELEPPNGEDINNVTSLAEKVDKLIETDAHWQAFVKVVDIALAAAGDDDSGDDD